MIKAALVFALYTLVPTLTVVILALVAPTPSGPFLAPIFGVPFGVAGMVHATHAYRQQKAS